MRSRYFFSSRRRHTRYWRDWSSDVCSSDLDTVRQLERPLRIGRIALRLRDDRLFGHERVCFVEHGRGGGVVEIGRASCRERVEISVVGVSLKKKHILVYRHSLFILVLLLAI